jgi:hypothetical protein
MAGLDIEISAALHDNQRRVKGYGTKGIALPGTKQLSSVVVGLDGQWKGARFAAACRGVGAGRSASSGEVQGKYGVSAYYGVWSIGIM